MTLLPDLYMIDVFNLSDEDLARLSVADRLTVSGIDDSSFCYGEIQDVFTWTDGENEITTIAIADGQSFWETPVCKTYGAGLSVRQTVLGLIDGITGLGTFLADDLKLPRGQSFCGKLPYAISDLAQTVDARAFLTSEVLHIVAKGRAENILTIQDNELLENPSYANGIMVLRTIVKGYSVGLLYEVSGRRWRLVKQVTDADNQTGPWRSELTFVDESQLSSGGMGGGL